MAGGVQNIKVCSPLKLRSDLTRNSTQSARNHIIYH